MGCKWLNGLCSGDDGLKVTTSGKVVFGKGPTFADFKNNALKCLKEDKNDKFCKID